MSDEESKLAKITEPELVPPSEKPDKDTQKEDDDLERQKKKAVVRSLEQDIKARGKYAGRIFCLICTWLGSIFLLLVLQGFKTCLGFHLSDKVLIAVITGTTINVLGLFAIVANYLFPRR